MPVGALGQAGRSVFHLIRRLREELKVNTTCGASNIAFGLPNRHALNANFLAMAIGAGMTSAITNPLHAEETTAVLGADVLMGHDPDCRRWLTGVPRAAAPRAKAATGASAAAGGDESRALTEDRARRLHAVGQARALRARHAAARGRARARASTSIRSAAGAASAGAAR